MATKTSAARSPERKKPATPETESASSIDSDDSPTLSGTPPARRGEPPKIVGELPVPIATFVF